VPDEVAAALLAQDERLVPNPIRRANALAIARREAAVVVTGQQVGLFLGPLYTFYKAATAISAARALEAETGVRCVPMFWLQTEDHDFAEIDHCFVPDEAKIARRIGLQRDAARISVAERSLGEEVVDCLDRLERSLAPLEHGAEAIALFRRGYAPGRTLSSAFSAVVAEVFREEGLVLFDARDPGVARASAPIYSRALREAEAIDADLAERSRALEAAGFEAQVKIREGSPLVFHHEESAQGPRERMLPRGDGFIGSVSGKQVARRDLEQELASDPMRFSTSALLRPLVQDAILPTAAYVGGPAEVGYFAQLGPLYRRFGVEPAMIVPRARFRVIDEASKVLLARLGLSAADLESSKRDLIAKAARAIGGELPSSGTLREGLFPDLSSNLGRLADAVTRADPTLATPAEKTRSAVEGALEKLFAKYDRAIVERDRVLSERIDRLRAFLFPEEQPQERVLSLPWFIARWGLAGFKARIFEKLSPFAARIEDVTP
jgi:bacillithiol synthase